MRKKEDAYKDFMEMSRNSWTYERLEPNEREAWEKNAHNIGKFTIFGTYKKRFDLMNALYHLFLAGCGYDGPNWRAEEMDLPFC